MKDSNEIELTIEGEPYIGKLKEDKIHWNDGDIWFRIQASASKAEQPLAQLEASLPKPQEKVPDAIAAEPALAKTDAALAQIEAELNRKPAVSSFDGKWKEGGSGDKLSIRGDKVTWEHGATTTAGDPVPPQPNAAGQTIVTRGNWAEITVGNNPPYYANLLTGAKQNTRPADFGAPGIPGTGSTLPIRGTSVNSNVYVGCMPIGINEFEFRNLFAPYGQIMSSRLMTTKNGGTCGFVKYTSFDEAQMAINTMNGLAIHGTKLKVSMAYQDNLGFNPAMLRLTPSAPGMGVGVP